MRSCKSKPDVSVSFVLVSEIVKTAMLIGTNFNDVSIVTIFNKVDLVHWPAFLTKSCFFHSYFDKSNI